jgi:predicted amidophosphoribosyltransferase
MATVAEISDPYANFMLGPLGTHEIDVCRVCRTFTSGYPTCYACGHQPEHADCVLPISYSVHLGQLHTALRGYKRASGQVADKFRFDLAAVLWRFLAIHEKCLADELGVAGFDVVTTVPSSDRRRDQSHPLRDIVGRVVAPTRDRYVRLLERTEKDVASRTVDLEKFGILALVPRSVLLIDDTWTTGANVQSAAGALKAAGATKVGVVVIGRHVHDDYGNNDQRLRALQRGFDWGVCALD